MSLRKRKRQLRSRPFNIARIALITAAAATLFYVSPVWLWFLTACFSTFYALKNLKRSRDVTLWRKGDLKAIPLEVFWAKRRLEQEGVISVAVVAAFLAGCWAVYISLAYPSPRPTTVTFLSVILPLVLTIVHTSLAVYSWLVHHAYHQAIQFIQSDLLLKQSLEKRLTEVTKKLDAATVVALEDATPEALAPPVSAPVSTPAPTPAPAPATREMSDAAADRLTAQVSDEVTAQMSDHMATQVVEKMSDDVVDRVSEAVVEHFGKKLTE